MPSRSKAQHRLMEAAARDPAVARRVGISQATAREFVRADAGRVSTLPEHTPKKRVKVRRRR
ncbi:MAG TPA: hypothetical protein VF178_09750 [Gemmatimonadaceae bacterium]